MYKIFLLLLSITTFSYSSFPIEERHIQKPRHLPDAELVFKNKTFYVIRNGSEIPIKQYDTGKDLRGISKKQLKAFLKSGYLCLKQFNNGDYALYANTRGVGGGPVTGWIASMAVRGVGYGVPVALGAKAIAVGGAVVVAKAGGGMVAKGTVAASSKLLSSTIATTAGGKAAVAIGEGVVAAVGAEAATATAVGVASGCIGTYVSVVEGTATAAQVGGTLIWWLP